MKSNTESEIWKPVVGYEGVYSVSSYGNVRREQKRTNGKVGSLIKPFLTKTGYYRVELSMNGRKQKWFVARLVARAFCVGYAEDLFVDHIDANRLNNHYSNLEWVTHGENQRRARKLGLFKGYCTPIRKLSPSDVLKIRNLSKDGRGRTALAIMFGVNQSTITRIVLNQRRTKGVINA